MFVLPFYLFNLVGLVHLLSCEAMSGQFALELVDLELFIVCYRFEKYIRKK